MNAWLPRMARIASRVALGQTDADVGAASDASTPSDSADVEHDLADEAMSQVGSWVDSVRGTMPPWLRTEYMGIELWQYFGAFLCILVGFVLKKISDFIFEKTIVPAAKGTRFKFDHLIADAVSKPLGWLVLLVGFAAALAMLNLEAQSEAVRTFIIQAVKVAFAADFLWFVFRLIDVVAVYLSDQAARTHSKLDDQLVPLLKKSMKFFVGVLIVIAIVQNMGYNVGSLLAGLGIGGLAVAMAAQDTLANFFGGIVIFTDHPFRLGDWVKVGDVEGTVEKIGFRSTRIRTWPKTLVTIPNSQLVSQNVDNKTAMPLRRVTMTVGVTYETTAEQMEALLEDLRAILRDDPDVDQEFVVVRFVNFGESSLDILLYYFTKPVGYADHTAVLERINLSVMRAIASRGLSVAFPTRTLYLEGDVARTMARIGLGDSPNQ